MVDAPLAHEGLYRERVFKPSVPYGSPVGVWKANSSRSPSSSAFRSNDSRPESSNAERSPPSTRMVTCHIRKV